MDKLRYEKLSKRDASMASLYVTYPNTKPEARQKGQSLAKKVRQECKTTPDELLEEGMKSLRERL